MDIVGYSDRLVVAPGETIRFMVSARVDYVADVVRLVHGDDDPAGPGFKEEVVAAVPPTRRRARMQELRSGSYAVCPAGELPGLARASGWHAYAMPTALVAREQALVGKGSLALVLAADGSLGFRRGDAVVATGVALRLWEWYRLSAEVDGDRVRLEQRPVRRFVVAGAVRVERALPPGEAPAAGPFTLAGRVADGAARDHFNGRLDSPRVEVAGAVAAAWDLSRDIGTRRITDVSGNDFHGETVNLPTRAVTGHDWGGRYTSFHDAPAEYGAIHFHDDDLDDARWEPDVELVVPALRSGIYAARLRGDGGAEEHLPFVVRPPRDRATASAVFLAPTLSYLAYANEHYSWSPAFAHWAAGNVLDRLTERDRFMAEHRLLSLYDFHTDGTGNCTSSYLRPLLSLRPRYDMPLIAAPHQFNADLHLADWLETKGFPFDVVTDHDLHEEGVELLARYRTVLTGSHPEYWTGQMLDALGAYLDGGGRLMYLGGNGFWWTTSIHPDSPHAIEIRRGHSGSSPWRSLPGEVHHAGTGEFGGQWRYRGRAPQRLVGVGFTSQGSDASRPYRRLPASEDPRVAFVFEGVGDGPIGDGGLVLGAAGGAEIDRADVELGTPPHALVVAVADGYSDMYQAQQDDTLFHDSRQGGTQSPLVRADMTFFETPAGGAVFAPGSISWCGSLSHAGYDNSVSRITENVLRRFLDETPFPFPG